MYDKLQLALDDLRLAVERATLALSAHASAIADSEGDHDLVADTRTAFWEGLGDVNTAVLQTVMGAASEPGLRS